MSVRFKLSVMMFLEFAIWGAWLPLVFNYLGELNFTPNEKGWIMNAFPIAAILAMFFSNQFADRNFSAEKFTAFSHLVGGVSILSLAWVSDFWTFFLLMLVHCVFYVPTISITNSIAFTHLKDAQREFSLVRLWGTIGWIAVGLPFIFIMLDWTKIGSLGDISFLQRLGALLDPANSKHGDDLHHASRFIFMVAGGCSLLLALFCLTLPSTPPNPAKGTADSIAWLEAIRLLRHPYILVLFLVTFVDSAVHAGYFLFANSYLESIGIQRNWIMPVMSVGQFAEIGTMAILGYCLKSLGWRNTMALGVLGYTVRFAMFAYFPFPAVAIVVNVLHGFCYAFFFATVYIFVDEYCPKDARSSAQGLFNFMILGLGQLVGNFLWPYLEGIYTTSHLEGGKMIKVIDYQHLFLYPAGASLVAGIFLLLFFRPPAKPDEHG